MCHPFGNAIHAPLNVLLWLRWHGEQRVPSSRWDMRKKAKIFDPIRIRILYQSQGKLHLDRCSVRIWNVEKYKLKHITINTAIILWGFFVFFAKYAEVFLFFLLPGSSIWKISSAHARAISALSLQLYVLSRPSDALISKLVHLGQSQWKSYYLQLSLLSFFSAAVSKLNFNFLFLFSLSLLKMTSFATIAGRPAGGVLYQDSPDCNVVKFASLKNFPVLL